MHRRLQMEGLQAEISTLSNIINQAKVLNDPLGEYQLTKRKASLEKELSECTANTDSLASVAVYFGGKPVFGSRGISADFAGRMLNHFQDLVGLTFAKVELGTLAERGRIPRRDATNLMITEIAKGSFGFILNQISDQDEFEITALKNTVEEVAKIIERTASSSDLDFEEMAESIDARTLAELKSFFATLDSSEATMRIVEDTIDLTLDVQSIHRAKSRTEATSIKEDDIQLEGVLSGFLPEHKKFEFKLDTKTTVFGSVTLEAAKQYSDFLAQGQTPVGNRYKIKVQRRKVTPLNRPSREVYRLLEFANLVQIKLL